LATPFELSVIVTTYQRPGHLRRCLLSLAAQQGVAGKFEVIVVDDGSRDGTAEMVARTAREVGYPLQFITHPHEGFQVGRCRNSGIRASRAPYIVFVDGDCLLPPDHLAAQLAARRPGVARAGDCFRLDQPTTERIGDADVLSGRFMEWVAPQGRIFFRRLHRKMLCYQALRHSSRPKIVGWSMAMWRDQLERINGFDEQYRGWGCEDDDLGIRLRQSGARVLTSLGYTHTYHMWHPFDVTAPKQWAEGANVDYFRRPLRLSRCLIGIERRSLGQLAVRVVADGRQSELANELFPWRDRQSATPELEVLLWPCKAGRFSPHADCRVAVAREGHKVPWSIRRAAHATIRLGSRDGAPALRRQIEQLLGAPASVGRKAASSSAA
jgi:glycosyltransferase involved in cell wall biosynthesis